MSKARYKVIFEELWDKNKEMFQQFFILNNEYADPKKRQSLENDFQNLGKKVQKILQEGENDLCSYMEKGNNRVFSTKVSEKYWDEIRKYFRFIDQVGVVTKRL